MLLPLSCSTFLVPSHPNILPFTSSNFYCLSHYSGKYRPYQANFGIIFTSMPALKNVKPSHSSTCQSPTLSTSQRHILGLTTRKHYTISLVKAKVVIDIRDLVHDILPNTLFYKSTAQTVCCSPSSTRQSSLLYTDIF